MDPQAMNARTERHVEAGLAGKVEAAVSVSTPDIAHGVGWRTGPAREIS